jgi:phosphoribosylformylglycinamidine synthase subunit PurQ / glutaminase
MSPVAYVVSAPGTNRDHDVAFALSLVGATPQIVSLRSLCERPGHLDRAQILVFAGGFSHADALGAGALAALRIKTALHEQLGSFVNSGRPVLGICNGFQILVQAGLLPGTLAHNDHGNFVCRWVTLEATDPTRSVWTSAIDGPIECPVAHGEGRFLADKETLSAHSALRYANNTNPNGSDADTAGVTDSTGLVLGLMPHPENHVLARQHPRRSRGEHGGLALSLFRGGVDHVKARG